MEVSYFESPVVNGEVVCLKHLNPFTFAFFSIAANKNLRVRVLYSNHCFTEGVDKVEYANSNLPRFDTETARPRIFSPERYGLSLRLPSIIRGMNNGSTRVWQTSALRNWSYAAEVASHTGKYYLFFEVKKAHGKHREFQELEMRIIHPRCPPPL